MNAPRCAVCGELLTSPCRGRLTGRRLSIRHDPALLPWSVGIETLNFDERAAKEAAEVASKGVQGGLPLK